MSEPLGRADLQVKIRGYRVGLGEIEALLRSLPQKVREVVVIAREDRPGDKRLVAYIVPEAGPAPTPHELRDHLKQKLPNYMVPSAFVTLDALPLTPNAEGQPPCASGSGTIAGRARQRFRSRAHTPRKASRRDLVRRAA